MLPGRDGFDVAKTIRQQGIQTPILMLTARSQVVDRVVGLQARRRRLPHQAVRNDRAAGAHRGAAAPRADGHVGRIVERYQFGEVQVDVRKAEVMQKGVSLDLSAKEFQLLQLLHRAPRRHGVARRAAAGSVGLQLDAVHTHGRRARGVAAAEAGAQPARAAIHPHRARPRLQVRRADYVSSGRIHFGTSGRSIVDNFSNKRSGLSSTTMVVRCTGLMNRSVTA